MTKLDVSNPTIIIVQGDITKQQCDAIVNAANNSLLGGGGVDGAIHYVAGPELLAKCRTLNGCETGEAKITKGYNLPAKWVIHTVGPIWKGGKKNSELPTTEGLTNNFLYSQQEDELLANCYRNSLLLAEQYEIESIAFPCISTGVYGFPKERAAVIAIREVKKFLEQTKSVKKVIFVCFSRSDFEIYQSVVSRVGNFPST
jgi:O-acetyl-ADP-ribose deacetylase (regulator of RNase III)